MNELKIKLSPLMILAACILPLAIIIAAVPSSAIHKDDVVSPDALLQSFNDGVHYVTPDVVADVLVQKDPSYLLIDVRNAEAYNEFHLPNAINIPLHDILAPEWQDYLNQDVRTNVFYSNGTVEANQAWMLCKLRGYQNNYVLQGGLNFWAQTIMNPQKPDQTAPDDEMAKYNFRKAANTALGGGSLEEVASTASSSKPAGSVPAATPSKKKKRTSGGCS
jgi:rhodanese-related sulfurtransferase